MVISSELTWHNRWAYKVWWASIMVLTVVGWFVRVNDILQMMTWLAMLVLLSRFWFAGMYRVEIFVKLENGGIHQLDITRYPLANLLFSRIEVSWNGEHVSVDREPNSHMAPALFRFGKSPVKEGRVARIELSKELRPTFFERLYKKSGKPFHVFVDGQDIGAL
jgi:hypothetical protein